MRPIRSVDRSLAGRLKQDWEASPARSGITLAQPLGLGPRCTTPSTNVKSRVLQLTVNKRINNAQLTNKVPGCAMPQTRLSTARWRSSEPVFLRKNHSPSFPDPMADIRTLGHPNATNPSDARSGLAGHHFERSNSFDVLLPPARRNLPCLGALSSPRPPAASSLCCTGFPSLPPWDPIPHSFTLSFPNTCTIRSLYSLTLSSLALFLPPSHPSPLLFSPSLVPAIPLSSTHELLPFVAFLIAFTPLRSPSTQPLPRYFL
ncbi:hypothetical protein FN846DRAFT_401769 [Sphaerosporella brunnea]|uniref:Uncharacterized protein n=1 Tax=Sphaerosporella brunnea TaxID=1250544 RepID=A0A5J5EH82_9PEZI|nr:hypothetical protein FN846DRAFT_401769 [Sphaerosporella brunnea]